MCIFFKNYIGDLCLQNVLANIFLLDRIWDLTRQIDANQ